MVPPDLTPEELREACEMAGFVLHCDHDGLWIYPEQPEDEVNLLTLHETDPALPAYVALCLADKLHDNGFGLLASIPKPHGGMHVTVHAGPGKTLSDVTHGEPSVAYIRAAMEVLRKETD